MPQKLKMRIMRRFVLSLTLLAFALGMKAQGDHVTRETRVYSIIGNDTLKVDAYINQQAEVKAEGRPVILYVHGGGFTMGSRVNAAQEVYMRYMAEHGWLAVAMDYRLAGVASSPDGIVQKIVDLSGSYMHAVKVATADVVDATNFVLQQKDWKANPNKFCLGGGSAGAMATLQLIYDACNDEAYTQKLPQGFAYAGAISQAGCIAVDAGQSLTWKKKPCPIMLLHGTRDTAVPLGVLDIECRLVGTLPIAEQLDEMGVPYWKCIVKGADHVIAMQTLTSYLEEQYRFLHDFVENGLQTTVNMEVKDKVPANMSSVEAMIQYVPLYILGYGQYLEQLDWNNLPKPDSIVY